MRQTPDQFVERVLESAVVVSWPDLIPASKTGMVHIEYEFAPPGSMDHLQVWTSTTRGYWLLACTYDMATTQVNEPGIHFENGCRSKRLADNLSMVMQHQNAFVPPQAFGRRGLIQVTMPTKTEGTAAAESISAALETCAGQTR